MEDNGDSSIQVLVDYIKKERLITVTNNSSNNIGISRTTTTRKQKWEEKQLYRYVKRQTGDISHEKKLTWLRKGNLNRETESFQIAARENTIRGKFDNTQDKCKRRLCCDTHETINQTTSEYSKRRLRLHMTGGRSDQIKIVQEM